TQILAGLFFLLALSSTGHCAPTEVKLGATLPLTGRLAVVGQDVKRGIELGVEDFASDEVKVVPLFEDNQHEPRQAIASAHKLLDVDKVDVIVSMWDMADIIAPLAEQKKVPQIAIRWNPDIAQRYKYTFTIESTYQSYCDSLLELVKKLSVDSISLITEEGQGWILASDYLKAKAPAANIKILSDERFISEAADYRTLILRAVKKKPGMVVLFTNPPHTEALIKQFRDSAPAQKFTGYFEVVDPALVEGIPFVAQFDVADWFNEKFRHRFDDTPKSRAAQAYDLVYLLTRAAKHAKAVPGPDSIIEVLSSDELKSGAAGPLFVTAGKTVESKNVWKIAHEGKYTIWNGVLTNK
ncbi:MAG: ABC transporter substrate-binding protein, partial [Deltaproteobacteria bacterium]|nr:ABC transporter substrate-binding protein [Deltaproteobacteria bacterium]